MSSDRLPPGSPGVFISGAEMAKANEAAGAADMKAQDAAADMAPADRAIAAGTIAAAEAVTAEAAAAAGDAADFASETVEHPLDIISEIEHLLRIVGNVAVHEFRRISERLADLKNHSAIKPGE
ncbi:hypothetical protein [Burkholderia cepacia]|uniref:DUF86 domain-containing protein n=1 Tax=Burkholderia cepacia TaxID=292 RepID=A0AAX2RSG2_BURCE|nr:hypothetical protein [Burkholderia cepacia]TES97922.1 hypothetical protein E3D36_30380 [Burkholderia cepacia]TEU43219.1 hypothetical protein E3D38_30190 [Burkholderia cepacia]TEU52144.1 hypothetical protein E3D37_05630 [Burkholderia cepacia]TEU91349.1 hypothetical protein E3D40_33040 [Burkholderia cepacia]TEV19118.1 hypothetical protein E3D45_38315 [Burkholderia cepacia]